MTQFKAPNNYFLILNTKTSVIFWQDVHFKNVHNKFKQDSLTTQDQSILIEHV